MKTNNGTVAESETGEQGTVHRPAGKPRSEPASTGHSGTSISVDERRQLIAEAAWFRAEARGFSPDGELDDWLAAEAEVDKKLLHR